MVSLAFFLLISAIDIFSAISSMKPLLLEISEPASIEGGFTFTKASPPQIMEAETLVFFKWHWKVVGNAFVEQYYRILYNSPDLAHRFYHDSSVISWLDSNGVMASVTTLLPLDVCFFGWFSGFPPFILEFILNL
ncbi:hypothetical protein F3Y22_tig00111467pilonHSYRG00068 [Hibiscus syriacus]|uniref:NTF2 domain-containing protein n=1 Tax=Hibiscus syriacus TaxID=106335 RepID=A0A6A2YKL8_HIBSY|nr:hypothetical protein F3Y22_tig00111467pilonHSYRG00068 [Hibiscus syriacus]